MVRIIVIRFFIAGPVLSFYESFFGYIYWEIRKNNRFFIDVFISTTLIGYKYYTEIREITICDLEV